MGNSEVGHLNIGAGRIVYQDLVKINKAIASGSILDNPQVKAAYEYAQKTGHALHLMDFTTLPAAFIHRSTTSLLFATSPRNTNSRRFISTASWMAATPTPLG